MLKFKSRNPKIRIPTFYLYYLPRTRRLMAGGVDGCEARRRGGDGCGADGCRGAGGLAQQGRMRRHISRDRLVLERRILYVLGRCILYGIKGDFGCGFRGIKCRGCQDTPVISGVFRCGCQDTPKSPSESPNIRIKNAS